MQLAEWLPYPSGKAEDALHFGGLLLRLGLGAYGLYSGMRSVEGVVRELRNGHGDSDAAAVTK